MSVTPDQLIAIKAPAGTPRHTIQQAINNNMEWILSRFATIPPKYQYIHSENHFYLGQAYPLYIEENPHKPQDIFLKSPYLYLSVRQNTPLRIRSLLNHWYKLQAFQIFSQRIHHFRPVIPWIDWEHAAPALHIKKMIRQWGNYNRKENGIITINQHLIKAELTAIDYVILHELCHAAEFNHGKGFYSLLEKLMPDWRKWKLYLQKNHLFIDQE